MQWGHGASLGQQLQPTRTGGDKRAYTGGMVGSRVQGASEYMVGGKPSPICLNTCNSMWLCSLRANISPRKHGSCTQQVLQQLHVQAERGDRHVGASRGCTLGVPKQLQVDCTSQAVSPAAQCFAASHVWHTLSLNLKEHAI